MGKGGGKGGPSDSVTQQTSIPEWEQTDWQNLIGKADTQTSKDIAAVNQPQMMSGFRQGTQSILNNQVNPAKLESGILSAGKESWTDPGTASSYMDPYENTALKSQVNLDRTNLLDPALAQSDESAAAAGALGGDRAEVAKSNLNRDFNNTEANTIAQGENTAYQTGQNQFNSDAARRLQGETSGAQTNLAGANSNIYANFAAGQNNLNEIAASEAPGQQLASEAGILSSLPKQGTTQQDEYKGGGGSGQILGGIMSGLSFLAPFI